jgi:DNA-binding CsgD family transcriptional regulator
LKCKSSWDRLIKLEELEKNLVERLNDIRREKSQVRRECVNILGNVPESLITSREREVIDLLRDDPKLQNKEIAAKMNISLRMVKFHMSNIFIKYNVKGRIELAFFLK